MSRGSRSTHDRGGSSRSQPDLLERERELEELERRLDAAATGAGSLVVVEGAAGVGKTELLRAVAQRARKGRFVALTARGGHLEQGLAFDVVRQLFEPVLRALPDEQREEALAGAAGLARRVLDPDATAELSGQSLSPSYPAMHGLYWLSANLAAERCLVIVVDDVHWGDAASLRWLNYLAARLDGMRLLLLVAARAAESGPNKPLLDALLTSPAAVVLHPAPLSEAATRQLIATVFRERPDDAFVGACHRGTGGNPFLLGDLVRALVADGFAPTAETAEQIATVSPATVARSVLLRLARLGPEATSLAKAVAVLGGALTLRQAAELAGLDESTAARCADLLAQADILTGSRPLDFVHPIVRAAVHAELPPSERMAAHRRAAGLLAAEGAEADYVAAHLLAAEPARDPWVVEQLRAAARQALARGAPQAAVECLGRALREPPPAQERADVLLELGSAEATIASAAAAEHLKEALELTPDPAARASPAVMLGRCLVHSDRAHEAVEVLDEVLAGVAERRELALTVEGEAIAAAVLDPQSRASVSDRLRRFEQDAAGDPQAERVAAANLAMEAVRTGRHAVSKALGYANRALEGGRLLARFTSEGPVYYLAAYALVLSDAVDAADEALSAALADASERGSAMGAAIALTFLALNAYRRGRLPDAETDSRRALALATDSGFTWGIPRAVAFSVDVLLERGQLKEAAQLVAENRLDTDLPSASFVTPLLLSRGRLRLAEGRVPEGLEDLALCRQRCEEWGDHNPTIMPWRSTTALALARVDELEQARSLVDQEVELARRFGAPRALGMALRAAGLVHRGEDGLEFLREAVGVLAASPARLERARAMCDLGAALRRAGIREAARPPLREALDLATRCGATVLAGRAREELIAAGAKPRRDVITGRDALTVSERRVAVMAAQGRSNREIAQDLFLTLRTVETHLTRVYRKLGIGQRKQLPEALGEEPSQSGR